MDAREESVPPNPKQLPHTARPASPLTPRSPSLQASKQAGRQASTHARTHNKGHIIITWFIPAEHQQFKYVHLFIYYYVPLVLCSVNQFITFRN